MGSIHDLRQRFTRWLWAEELRRIPPPRRHGIAALRVAFHVLRSFSQNLASLQAAGLTLVTVLAVVPTLALATSLAKALGYADRLRTWLIGWKARFPDDVALVFDWLLARIDGINFGALGLVGSIVVLGSGLSLFTRVEQSLNRIWRTRRNRPWHRRIADFVALAVIVPPLALLAFLGASLLGGSELSTWLRERAPWLASLQSAGSMVVPHVLAWIAFTALYRIMPSAAVRWRGALVGGVVAGSSLLLLHGLYLRLNVGVAQANAVYLTFAALPILLVYLQLLWTVVLAGGEVGYAVQHLGKLRGSELLGSASRAIRERIAWHVLAAAAERFRAGDAGVVPGELPLADEVPPEWIEEVTESLVRGGLLAALQGDVVRVMPARPPERIEMAHVAAVLDGDGDARVERIRLPERPEAALEQARGAELETLRELRF